MVRRFHRSIYDELDDLKASMDYLFQLAFEPTDNPLLPEEENPGILCWYPRTFRAEITEHDDEVIVTVDIIPGIENSKISVDLVSPETLKITVDREAGENQDIDQRSFSLHHIIPLQGKVTTYGARSTFKNGVLDIHLRRVQPENK
ncbi:MAG: Hsp20/alpha crystallin family protein [Methanoregula sp.]|jgi:HSP20 family protein